MIADRLGVMAVPTSPHWDTSLTVKDVLVGGTQEQFTTGMVKEGGP